MASKKVLAFDFGASGGRAMLGEFDGSSIRMTEIHRFPNEPVMVRGRLYWDVLRLFFEMKTAILKTSAMGGFDAIGIDTWGVDFGLLSKNGMLLENPVHYRDSRTEGISDSLFSIIPKSELYQKTGIQFVRFNTIYQLFYLAQKEPGLLSRVDKILMLPDLFAYFLTGEKRSERTISSTGNLLNPESAQWDLDLCAALSIPSNIFAPMIDAGAVYGMLSDGICEELGCKKVPVIAVATHDTASAVVSVPTLKKDFVYISSGTWSLLGTECDAPIINAACERANFTNEIGFDHKIRFLRNIMGLWLVQESRRQWAREGSDVDYDTLSIDAGKAEPFLSFVDPDDPVFIPPGNMPEAVRKYCAKTGQKVPESRGEIVRCIYQSLALKYKYNVLKLEALVDRTYDAIHIMGGGSRNVALSRMTASACGIPVLCGPLEATVLGNIAVQLIALGVIKDLSTARQIIAQSTQITRYDPAETDSWQSAYHNFLEVTGLR